MGSERLVCVRDGRASARWTDPTTGSSIDLERAGIYRISKSDGEYDRVIVLGTMSVAKTVRILDEPQSMFARDVAWMLLQQVDLPPKVVLHRGLGGETPPDRVRAGFGRTS